MADIAYKMKECFNLASCSIAYILTCKTFTLTAFLTNINTKNKLFNMNIIYYFFINYKRKIIAFN